MVLRILSQATLLETHPKNKMARRTLGVKNQSDVMTTTLQPYVKGIGLSIPRSQIEELLKVVLQCLAR